MRKWMALLIVLCILPISSLADNQPAKNTNQYKMVKIDSRISYFPELNRYVNNVKAFDPSRMTKKVKQLNIALDAMKDPVPSYLYLVESSRTHPMTDQFSEDSKAYEYLKKNLHVTGTDHLKYSTFSQFCEYFYTTDHHWNYKGSYQGYKDIVHMLLGSEEPVLEPVETVEFPIIFNGAYSRQLNELKSTEEFAIYRFENMPKYTAYVNGKKRSYDRIQSYLDGKYSTEPLANHYQLCYGGNYAQIVFEMNQPDKPNLLMFCNSLGAPLKALLAGHFNRIVCIDWRYYQKEYNEIFSLNKAIKDYEIDQILIVGDAQIFIDTNKINP